MNAGKDEPVLIPQVAQQDTSLEKWQERIDHFEKYLESERKSNEISRFALDVETHRSRRNLIAAASVGLFLSIFHPNIAKISLLGVEITTITLGNILAVNILVIIYEMSLFLSRCLKDYAQWRIKTQITKNLTRGDATAKYTDLTTYILALLQRLQMAGTPSGMVDISRERQALVSLTNSIQSSLNRFFFISAFASGYTKFYFRCFELGFPLLLAAVAIWEMAPLAYWLTQQAGS